MALCFNESSVILAQSDTTAGFFSQDAAKLNATKNSPPNKPLLQVLKDFKALKKRVPTPHRFLARRIKATLIYPGTSGPQAFRVIQDAQTLAFLERLDAPFSTSANLHGMPYEPQVALELADIIVEDRRGLYASKPSLMIKFSRTRKRRLR